MNDTLLSIHQAADILGVHWQTVRNYIEQNKLPSHKIGKLIRIQRTDLDKFINGIETLTEQIEIEQRYLIKSRKDLEKKLLDFGAIISYQAHVIDHWFLPINIKTREQHDEWFDKGRGCGIRIREQDNGYTGNIITSLETKRLTKSMNHNTFLEGAVTIESYEKTKAVLEMMDLREFLTIDKNRVMYKYKSFKICFDDIKNFGTGVEIEASGFATREKALKAIDAIANKLGFNKTDTLEKSMTVLAMQQLAKFQ